MKNKDAKLKMEPLKYKELEIIVPGKTEDTYDVLNVDFEYEVPARIIMSVLYEILTNDNNFNSFSTEDIYNHITAYYPELKEKYYDKILEYFKEEATEFAEKEYLKDIKIQDNFNIYKSLDDYYGEVILEFKDLEIEITIPKKDEYYPETQTLKVNWNLEIDASVIGEVLANILLKDITFKKLEEKEFDKYLFSNFETLLEQYNKQLEYHFEDEARTEAEIYYENHPEKLENQGDY